MKLEEKLQLLRKQNGYSQEQLADKIGIARQTISKWENGQAVPELNGLILLSELYGVTIDRIVKENDECKIALSPKADIDIKEITAFLIKAKRNTYAAKGKEAKPSRTNSHDFGYEDNSGYTYYDTYLGGERFAGEEAVWLHQNPVWSMNYAGRVTGDSFDGDFLKEVLMAVPEELPYRGPEIYTKGDYRYHSKVDGEFVWFQGYEEIFYLDTKIYECYFHGGILK
ncbi:MAG: helix-turn-helix transcriptional regulator [Lachnospiraceae bacterium]|nr:helix-turn-helix transcriptional regulator [Lachnospiraceae bacterium]